MSLLLDALKRAEQEKLARAPQGGPPPQPPPPPTPRAPAPAAVSALELQPLGGEGARPAGPAAGTPRGEGAAHAAQVVFQAKSPASSSRPERKLGMVWATVGAVAVVVIAAAAYVWYSINALTPQLAAAPRPPPAPVPAPASGSAPAMAALDRAPAQPAAPAVATLVPVPGAAALDPRPSAAPPPAPAAPAADPAPAAPVRESLAESLLRDAAAAAPPLQLDRTPEAPPRIPADIAAGYEALREGRIDVARRRYGSALAADPANVDARLGLATAEARAGNRPAAAHHYRRALEVDPGNATALAGLAALADFSRPEALESQLRADVERHPGSAALRFTLGALYAAQRRWHDAQAQFFEAHRLEPGGADILFNLAVSLDHLGQTRLAADFYARALEAARAQPAQFDPAAAARRLAEIR